MDQLGIFDDLKTRYNGDADIKIKKDSLCAVFEGPSFNVNQLKEESQKLLKSVGISKLNEFLDKYQHAFLLQIFHESSPPSFQPLRYTITMQLTVNKIKAFFRVGSEPKLVYKLLSDYTATLNIIQQLVVSRRMGIERFDELIQRAEFKRKEQAYNQQGNIRLYKDATKSEIIFVGLKDAVEKSYSDIAKHVKDNIIETETIRVPCSFRLFLKTFPQQLEADVNLANVEWTTTDGGVRIKGKCIEVSKAKAWIEAKKDTVMHEKKQVNDPGMPQYFHGKSGLEFLETTQTLCSCIVSLKDFENLATNDTTCGQIAAAVNTPVTLVKSILRSDVSIYVMKADITELQCDAIVNASNEELELRNAGVSGSILRRGGPSIQKEMDKEKRKVGGKLGVGFAVSTSAGNLPCKKMIHVVGPTWDPSNRDRAKSKLKECVFSCLSECDQYGLKSVAIPAISCGVFGGRARECVQIIVEAIQRYFENQDSSVKKVILVELHKQEILDEFKTMVKNLGAPTSTQSHFQHTMENLVNAGEVKFKRAMYGSPSRSSTAAVSAKPKISLLQQDITDATADVIVTSTSPGNFANCHGSAVSKALLAKAGVGLKNSCHQAASLSSLQAGKVMQTPGFNLNCKEIYHVLLNNYNHSNESDLLNAVALCFAIVEKMKYTRIAFPAIGTGGMGYPPNILARGIKQAIDNFRGTYLKNVYIVLHPSDSVNIATFESVFQAELSNQIGKLQTHLAMRSSQQGVGSAVNVQILQGDILSSTRDAIVVPVSNNFQSGGQLSDALASRAGPSVKQECQSSPIHQSDYYRVTRSGNLSCKYIIHTLSPHHGGAIATILTTVLSFADTTLKSTSLALPAIGTGSAGVNSAQVAQSMAAAIQNFKATNPQHLKRIDIVVFQAQMLADFQSALSGQSSATKQTSYVPTSTSKPPPMPKPRVRSIIPIQNSFSSSDCVIIHLCSNKRKHITEAWKRIQDQVNDKSMKKFITNDVIDKLTQEEEEEIMELETKHNVAVRRSGRANGTVDLVISGLKDDVYKAFESASTLIQEYKEALTCAEYVIWKYKDMNTGELNDFPLNASSKLESAFKKDDQGQLRVEIMIRGQRKSFQINFSNMTEVSLDDRRVTSIVRSPKVQSSTSTDELPSNWSDMEDNPWMKVAISAHSSEYQQVVSKFQATGQFNVSKLERIQNPTLYKQYLAQKQKVEKRMAQKGLQLPVTRQLFHGTRGDVIKNICKDGFDRSHCGKNGTAFGQGVYFATTSSYSKGYAGADSQTGLSRMFLAEVITGEFCQGNSALKTPPTLPGSDTEVYDSVVNNVQSPGMFVVFRDASVYPSYVLEYR